MPAHNDGIQAGWPAAQHSATVLVGPSPGVKPVTAALKVATKRIGPVVVGSACPLACSIVTAGRRSTPLCSNAPLSQAPARPRPRWSVSVQAPGSLPPGAAELPLLIAGLVVASACVCVEPPWSASVAASTSATLSDVTSPAPAFAGHSAFAGHPAFAWNTLWPSETMRLVVPPQSDREPRSSTLPSTMLFRNVTFPKFVMPPVPLLRCRDGDVVERGGVGVQAEQRAAAFVVALEEARPAGAAMAGLVAAQRAVDDRQQVIVVVEDRPAVTGGVSQGVQVALATLAHALVHQVFGERA